MINKDFPVASFDKVNLKGNFTVFYIKSPKNLVSVNSYPNIIKNLNIEVKNGVLTITQKKQTQGVDMYQVSLYSQKDLRNVSIADSTDMTISSQMTVSDFKLNITNAARFSGAVLANNVELHMNQKARANLLGRAINANVALKDSVSVISPYFYVENLKINADGDDYAEFSVDKNLSGNIKNNSKLVYYGEPKKSIKVGGKANLEQKKLP